MNPTQRRDFWRMLLATVAFGAVSGIFNSSLANYLYEVHSFSAEARGWLELPRELPGFLVIITAGFVAHRLREARAMSMAMLVTAAGAGGLALLAPNAWLAVLFIFVWSAGDHMNFTLEGPLGLKLAREGGEGHRLGQLGAARNLGGILGAGAIFALASQGSGYTTFFLLAGGLALAASFGYTRIQTGRTDAVPRRFVLRKEYGVFYAISALFGIRKQIFFVFGTWVLVDLHGVSVATIATLMLVGSALGVVARPLLGDVIDWVGERIVLSVDEVLLMGVCLAYAFAGDLLPPRPALWLLYGAYILDHTLFGLRVARTTYLKKIAVDPTDITPTMSMGITIDHMVAMSLPIFSGWLWEEVGFRWVFIMAAGIALVGLFVCLRIRVPASEPASVEV